MNHLLELVSILNKNQLKELPVYDFKPDQTLYGKMYHLVADSNGTSDETAIAQAMGYPDTKDNNYRKVKHRLFRRLQNMVLLIDFKRNKHGVYAEKATRLWKLTCLTEIFFGFSKKVLGEYLLKEAFALAEELDIPQSKIQLGMLQFRLIKDFMLVKDFSRLIQQLEAEIELKSINREVQLNRKMSEKNFKRVLRFEYQNLALHGQFFYFMLLIDYYLERNNIQKVAHYLFSAIQSFKQKRIAPVSILVILNNYKLIYALQVKDDAIWEEAIRDLEHQSPLTNVFNRFKTLEYKVIYCFHKKEYQKAYDLFGAFEMPRIRKKSQSALDQRLIEYYELIKVYLLYLKLSGKIDDSDNILGENRIFKFVNSMKVLRKDKTSFNILIQIITIALFIQKKDWDEALVKIESLKRYSYKFLDVEKYARVFSFIKMLEALKNASFSKQWLKNQLPDQTLLGPKISDYEVIVLTEYIPFQDLWGLLIKQTD